MGVMWTGSLNLVPRASLLVGGAPPAPHPPREGEKPRERGWGSLWTVFKQNGGRHVVFGRRSSFSLLVDPDCESVITLLIAIARKQQLARFVNQIVKLTV